MHHQLSKLPKPRDLTFFLAGSSNISACQLSIGFIYRAHCRSIRCSLQVLSNTTCLLRLYNSSIPPNTLARPCSFIILSPTLSLDFLFLLFSLVLFSFLLLEFFERINENNYILDNDVINWSIPGISQQRSPASLTHLDHQRHVRKWYVSDQDALQAGIR